MASGSELLLTPQQHSDLSSIAQSRSLPAGYVFRAKLILMLAQGASFNGIKRQLQTTAPTIVRWKQRFREYGLEGLDTYHPGQKPSVLTPAVRARILSATRKKPSDGSTHWSCRKLASVLGVSKDAVHRVWQEAGLKPLSLVKTPSQWNWPRVTLLHPHHPPGHLGEMGMLRFGKLLIRKVARERGVLTRDKGQPTHSQEPSAHPSRSFRFAYQVAVTVALSGTTFRRRANII